MPRTDKLRQCAARLAETRRIVAGTVALHEAVGGADVTISAMGASSW